MDHVKFLRSSRLEVFYKKGIPKNFAKVTGKYMCQILFFGEVTVLGLQWKLRRKCFLKEP